MLRVALTLLAASLASAAGADQVQTIPIRGVTPNHTCRTAGTDKFIGKRRSATMGDLIKDVTRAAVLRWAPPGTMLTMDYRADRVTVYLDTRRRITKLNCG